MPPELIENPDSVLGEPSATLENPGEPASSSGPNPEEVVLQEKSPEVTSVNLLEDVLQVEDVEPIRYNKDGSIRRKPGRKVGQKTGEGAPAIVKAPKTAAQIQAAKVSSEQTATVVIRTVLEVLVTTIGEEWQFESQQEADHMKLAVTAFIDAKGGASLSPETMLMLSLAGYGLPRARHQNTRDKFKAFFGGIWKAIRGVKRV